MKILITGKNGQVGYELQRALAGMGEIVAVGSSQCDFRNEVDLRNLVQNTAPDIIINCAAFTEVDLAESQPEEAHLINARAPAILAQEAQRLNAMLIHFSTDYVFDGKKPAPYGEDDATAPLNVYGASKLAGENAIRQNCDKYFILRTSWVMGFHGSNFMKTILRLACERDQLDIVADQIGAPTSAAHLADLVTRLVAFTRTQPETASGIYHATARGQTHWHEIASHIVQRAQAQGLPMRLSPDAIRPISSAEYKTPATRPLNSRLDCSKLSDTMGLQMPEWREGVDSILDQIIGKS
jgi:dTDP-4-dehydrorhamnose reductase